MFIIIVGYLQGSERIFSVTGIWQRKGKYLTGPKPLNQQREMRTGVGSTTMGLEEEFVLVCFDPQWSDEDFKKGDPL